MRIIKILNKTIMMLLLIIMSTYCVCYATSDDKGLPDLEGNYAPTIGIATDGNTVTIIGQILGVLTVVGIVASVIGIALVGFNSILGSASEKAANQEKYVGIVIAALLITGGSVIARFIISSAENLI